MKEKLIYFIRNYPILFIGFGVSAVIFCGALYGKFTEDRAKREYEREWQEIINQQQPLREASQSAQISAAQASGASEARGYEIERLRQQYGQLYAQLKQAEQTAKEAGNLPTPSNYRGDVSELRRLCARANQFGIVCNPTAFD